MSKKVMIMMMTMIIVIVIIIIIIIITKKIGSSSITSELHLRGTWLESRPGHLISRLRLLVAFLSLLLTSVWILTQIRPQFNLTAICEPIV
jgi:hypothetical protein